MDQHRLNRVKSRESTTVQLKIALRTATRVNTSRYHQVNSLLRERSLLRRGEIPIVAGQAFVPLEIVLVVVHEGMQIAPPKTIDPVAVNGGVTSSRRPT